MPATSRQPARSRRGSKRGSRRRRGQINKDVTGLSRTCRGRDGEVGIVEFGLNSARLFDDTLDVLVVTGGTVFKLNSYVSVTSELCRLF